ncbi:MAG: carboxypeptidase-like regulatory domain-containing protein [Gemmatimonadaceae bacterium]
MHRPITAFALTVLLATTAAAQSQMSGTVKDSTGRALPGAQVSIPALEKGSTTDDSGHYVLRDLPAGSHSMDVKRTGYKLSTATVEVGDKETIRRDFVLVANIAELEGMTAAAEKPAPVRASRTVISAQQITEGHFDNVYAAVEALKSAWLKPRGATSLSGGGSDKIWVYLDNVRVGDTEALRDINPREVLAVRFFDAAAAQARYGSGHPAGAIMVETAGYNKNKSP